MDDPKDFRDPFGRLLYVLSTDVEDGLLCTLVQFYNPVYRCFTFPDHQLLPIMEEYVYLLGIPVSYRVPFCGLEGILESQVIARAIHLKKSDVDANLTVKGSIRGLTSKFLIEKAFFLLMIFLVGNHVPTLLGDTYLSIHYRTSKGNGTIVCCAPLLYKWFISHLSQSLIFKENKGCLKWSQRLVSLTNDNITWYSFVYDNVEIIGSCGEFSNVPLLGTQGGTNYSLTLARGQVGLAMRDKPNNTLLEGLFFQEGKYTQELKARMVNAWHNIHRKGKSELGLKNNVALEPYTSWVKKRATELNMPYAYKRPMYLVVVKSLTINIECIEDMQEALVRMKQVVSPVQTRANQLKRMDRLEQENRELYKEVTTLERKFGKAHCYNGSSGDCPESASSSSSDSTLEDYDF
ncbi:uncharacterized protein LOC127080824 [Lathyrus oleraceus]|uniref:uncharacterized protein LOC127080824 n=1 Tax=Pisum sativum TaxID=3888 RepID=UPI0021D082BC|nr:uncharacterized protein LOC127080824 [Pisum sativum]